MRNANMRARLVIWGLCLLALLAARPAGAVGFAEVSAPDPDDQPLSVLVWYPSNAPAREQTIGLARQVVAADGKVAPGRHPLIVMSHGTGGSADEHLDTALALARAGYVVAAVNHTGDTWKDKRYSFTARNFTDRPRHIARIIDAMLTVWPGHATIDPTRIGIFGYSAGGYTALVAIGATPDLMRLASFCAGHPDDWGCSAAHARGVPPLQEDGSKSAAFVHDPRIKAAVIAAPAVGVVFAGTGLKDVRVPIQLWRGAQDHIVVDEWSTAPVVAALPRKPELHVVAGADHFAFLAPCSAQLAQMAPEICQDPPGFDRAAFHRVFDAEVVRFFRATLPPGEARPR
jgi:predicted dienelactone hydrolase